MLRKRDLLPSIAGKEVIKRKGSSVAIAANAIFLPRTLSFNILPVELTKEVTLLLSLQYFVPGPEHGLIFLLNFCSRMESKLAMPFLAKLEVLVPRLPKVAAAAANGTIHDQ